MMSKSQHRCHLPRSCTNNGSSSSSSNSSRHLRGRWAFKQAWPVFSTHCLHKRDGNAKESCRLVSENRQDYYAGETPGVEESTQCQLTVLSSCNGFFESAVLQASITNNQHNESTVRKKTQAANMNEVANSRNARVLVLIPSNTHIWPASTYCNFFASILQLHPVLLSATSRRL